MQAPFPTISLSAQQHSSATNLKFTVDEVIQRRCSREFEQITESLGCNAGKGLIVRNLDVYFQVVSRGSKMNEKYNKSRKSTKKKRKKGIYLESYR